MYAALNSSTIRFLIVLAGTGIYTVMRRKTSESDTSYRGRVSQRSSSLERERLGHTSSSAASSRSGAGRGSGVSCCSPARRSHGAAREGTTLGRHRSRPLIIPLPPFPHSPLPPHSPFPLFPQLPPLLTRLFLLFPQPCLQSPSLFPHLTALPICLSTLPSTLRPALVSGSLAPPLMIPAISAWARPPITCHKSKFIVSPAVQITCSMSPGYFFRIYKFSINNRRGRVLWPRYAASPVFRTHRGNVPDRLNGIRGRHYSRRRRRCV